LRRPPAAAAAASLLMLLLRSIEILLLHPTPALILHKLVSTTRRGRCAHLRPAIGARATKRSTHAPSNGARRPPSLAIFARLCDVQRREVRVLRQRARILLTPRLLDVRHWYET
jgi:hypothetical protein